MTTKQESAIAKHGRKLLAIFPNAKEQDPVKLCKKLRRLEAKGAAIALRLCTGPEFDSPEHVDELTESVLGEVDFLLDNDFVKCSPKRVPIFVNRDPRGYALKIDDTYIREHNLDIERDWGGYGLLAPEIKE